VYVCVYVCMYLAQIYRSGLICLLYPVRYKNKLQMSWVRILAKAIVFFLSLAANKAAEQAQKKAGTATAGAVGY
jgi:hypothetical protein